MINKKSSAIYLVLLTFLSFQVSFHATAFQDQIISIEVKQGFIRETIPGTSISSAYMTIHNTSSEAITLTGASSLVSKRLELHEHSMANGMMKMRQVENIVIPGNSEIVLKPSGLHVMIFDLIEPLKDQDKVLINLIFEDESIKPVTLPVRSIKQHKHHHH